MTQQGDHLARLAGKKQVRVSVRSICIRDGKLLVQRPADEPTSCYAFTGGRLEVGDTFESRIRAEYDEELGGRLARVSYLFVVENRFTVPEGLVHTVEHFLEVELEPGESGTREPHLVHSWLPLDSLAAVDLRPRVVRDALVDGSWRRIKHLIVPLDA
jgi:ADP-ribose pyrophosphatase YjhB (NUDIX family)